MWSRNKININKTFLKHFSDCLFYFCSTCADSIKTGKTIAENRGMGPQLGVARGT